MISNPTLVQLYVFKYTKIMRTKYPLLSIKTIGKVLVDNYKYFKEGDLPKVNRELKEKHNAKIYRYHTELLTLICEFYNITLFEFLCKNLEPKYKFKIIKIFCYFAGELKFGTFAHIGSFVGKSRPMAYTYWKNMCITPQDTDFYEEIKKLKTKVNAKFNSSIE